MECVQIIDRHLVEHHQQIDIAIRRSLAAQITPLQSQAKQALAECCLQCRIADGFHVFRSIIVLSFRQNAQYM